ncbi:MAG: hypothetical protein H0V01_06245 [Bacteroidetes bacterium]|nr:hypothetical protein [Bacteroidota bacterium]HET6244281.1 hypothetical protein [Bacteroidia bacterium]
MQHIHNIRKKIGEYFLKIELNRLNRKSLFKGFNLSNSIAVLFNASDKTEFELVKKYIKYLRDSNKKVKCIGYFYEKEVPEMVYSKNEFDFFSKKDLNWHLKPMSPFVSSFIEEEYDILIDFNLKNDFPLHYISSLSKAKFKIGNFTNDSTLYDLMIEMEDGKDLKYFMKNVDHYLLQLNVKSPTTVADSIENSNKKNNSNKK